MQDESEVCVIDWVGMRVMVEEVKERGEERGVKGRSGRVVRIRWVEEKGRKKGRKKGREN